ncbi:MAG TPA: sterol carrier family protein, partial [Arthrobacter sp.]|nr:sterol carrier family protein [Arthrobacter sp.]
MAVARRRIAVEEGRAALAAWQAAGGAGTPVPRSTLATAVRYSLEEVTARAPGNSVEVRVPPFGVTQCVEGPRH